MFKSIDISTKVNLKAIGIPIGIFVIQLILIIFVGNLSYEQYQKQIDVLDDVSSQESSLQIKLDTLSDVQIVSLDASNRSLVALPEKNPGLFMISQLKSLSQKHNLEVVESNIDRDNDFSDSISRAKIGMVFTGTDLDSLITFLKETTTLAPLSTVDSVTVNQTSGVFEMEMYTYVYWSGLPETLPSLSEPISNLSSNDEAILDYLSTLTVPSFTVLNPTDPIDRENPFR